VPSLIETYVHNRNRNIPDQGLFEVARVYQADSASETGVSEPLHAAGLLSGNLWGMRWDGKTEPVNFFHAKALAQNLMHALTRLKGTFDTQEIPAVFHPNRSASLRFGSLKVGALGELHPHVAQLLECTEPIVAFEINLENLYKYRRQPTQYAPISKFPSIKMDIALLVDKAIPAQQILDSIREAGTALLSTVSVFDVYEGDKVAIGKRSLAFRLEFSSPERTLQETEALSLRDRVIAVLTQRHGTQLRG
jgi:phenylalanyl-tRNA synthetase beta chain